MEKSLAGCIQESVNEVELSVNQRVVNRSGRGGIRRGTQRFFSATSGRTSATSALNVLLAISLRKPRLLRVLHRLSQRSR